MPTREGINDFYS